MAGLLLFGPWTTHLWPGILAYSPRVCQIAQMSKLISKISISIWKCNLTLRTKIDYIYFERHPVLKFAASWTGSQLTQRLITNCSEKPSLKSSSIQSPNKASWLPWRRDKDITNLLKPTTADSDGHISELATNLTWRMN